ncbi:MAG TPA: threonine/serine dehydratase [Vicinamibacterales bacterium]|nr:threonine/serine dehydratase [Vicinamibacterales bacterium]
MVDLGRVVGFADVLAARDRIAPHVARTPLRAADAIGRACGAHVLLKLESLQVTNSFKARGAANAVLQLLQPGSLIVAASGGNHGRAIAWAAERFGHRAIVFTPRTAPRAKTDAIRSHGADLRANAASYDEAEAQALHAAAELGATYISPYNHPHVIAGGGTVAAELFDQDPALDAIIVPIGGGGLISGIAIAAKELWRTIRVIGVEAEASAAFTAALAAGRPVEITVGRTVADGLGGNVERDTMTWPIIRDLVDQVVTVREEDLVAAMRHLAEIEHIVAEGAGAVALAAIRSGRVDVSGQRVAVLVTGGNVDLSAGT